MKKKSKKSTRLEDERSDSFNSSIDSERQNSAKDDIRGGQLNKKGKGGKQTNTIMQQINSFSLTPMNDSIAEQTIEDHKYLLEHVENRCAIAYFAAANRNLSLFMALRTFIEDQHAQAE